MSCSVANMPSVANSMTRSPTKMPEFSRSLTKMPEIRNLKTPDSNRSLDNRKRNNFKNSMFEENTDLEHKLIHLPNIHKPGRVRKPISDRTCIHPNTIPKTGNGKLIIIIIYSSYIALI